MKRSDKALQITSENCKPRDKAYLLQYEEALKSDALKDPIVVNIKSRDGLVLKGRLYKKQKNKPKAVIIAVHGFHSSGLRDMGRFADMYSRSGFDYLIVSQRSHFDSEGEYLTFGAKESLDVLDWVNIVRKIYTLDIPIILHGVSMGAATVLITAGIYESLADENNKPNIICCIADSAYDDIISQISYLLGKRSSITKSVIIGLFKANMRLRAKTKACDASPIESMTNIKIPAMFIHGKEDRYVLPENSIRLYDACNSDTKELVLIDGAGHACSYVVQPDEYEKSFISFVGNIIR
nr:alpha/beta hydrolase [uncultured Mogibacterium sp.]